MTDNQLLEVANNADMIVNGYAFTRSQDKIRILNLNNANNAAVITPSGKMVEASMDDIELSIALGYYRENADLMEA